MAERRQGVEVESGDVVLLRTGASQVRHDLGQLPPDFDGGWHSTCLPWLRERDVAAIGADLANDATQRPRYVHMYSPVHIVGLVAMGLWLLDNLDLEELSRQCTTLARYEFHFAAHALPMQGATGFAINPIATF
jgi:kynurenine formamidase